MRDEPGNWAGHAASFALWVSPNSSSDQRSHPCRDASPGFSQVTQSISADVQNSFNGVKHPNPFWHTKWANPARLGSALKELTRWASFVLDLPDSPPPRVRSENVCDCKDREPLGSNEYGFAAAFRFTYRTLPCKSRGSSLPSLG
eukprot:scaffold7747_cov363-Prasinococcus_capsulatus_cf.AAC.2